MTDNEDNSTDSYGDPEPTQNVNGVGVGIEEKPTLSKIWDPDVIVRQLELTWKGYSQQDDGTWLQNGKNAIARDEVIETTINSIRSFINSHNMIAKMEPEDIEFVLLEKIKEIIYSYHDEFSVDEDILENMVNQVDHVNETFMKGIVQKGHGANTLTQVYAGLHETAIENNKNKDFFQIMAEKINSRKN